MADYTRPVRPHPPQPPSSPPSPPPLSRVGELRSTEALANLSVSGDVGASGMAAGLPSIPLHQKPQPRVQLNIDIFAYGRRRGNREEINV